MINSRIQIEDGAIEDFFTKWGFLYLDADNRTAPDESKPAATSYAEEPGEHQDPRRVAAAFDYTAKFLIEAPNKNLQNVNSKIAFFNAAIRQPMPGTDVTKARQITFYNDDKHVKITGQPDLIAEPTEVYNSPRYGALDYAVVELKIRVTDPRKCDFNLSINP